MALKGDFIGFSYGGVRSEDMGIIRTSGGKEYNENLIPTLTDKTVDVPGGDGSYFFYTNYKQRQINVNFATDELTEQKFRKLRAWLNGKEILPLIFDEVPYKTYMAKITGTPSFKYNCYDNPRIYKGTGTITFTCYFPYAKSTHKYLNEYTDENKNEWAAASGMLASQGNYDTWANNAIELYNPSDIEVPFKLYVPISNLNQSIEIRIDLNNTSTDKSLTLNAITAIGQDTKICIDTKTNLIIGYNNNILSGNLYNSYINSGEFFKIGINSYNGSSLKVQKLICPSGSSIEYDYLYI